MSECTCPGCKGVPGADMVFGYDPKQVPLLPCHACKKKIGSEPWVVDTSMARFAVIHPLHKRCDEGGKVERDTEKRRKKWIKEGRVIAPVPA